MDSVHSQASALKPYAKFLRQWTLTSEAEQRCAPYLAEATTRTKAEEDSPNGLKLVECVYRFW